MTANEALAAVKRAVEFIPYLEARVELSNRNPKRPDGETIEEILLVALYVITSNGPLVCVPREPTEKMLDAGVAASERQSVSRIYRAMIAEGEK